MRGRGLLRCAVLAGAVLCWGQTLLAYSNPKLPEWVLNAAAEKTGPLPTKANAVVLYESKVLTIGRHGQAEFRMRQAVKILRPPGREDADPSVFYDKGAPLKAYQVWAIGPDGHHYAMKKYQYQDTGVDGYGILYSGDRIMDADPPGDDPGGIVAWEYVQKLPSYQHEMTWYFQQDVPVVKAVLDVNLPQGWNYKTEWFRHAPIQPEKVGPNEYRWEAEHVAGIDLNHVSLAPAWDALAARLVVHYSAKPLPKTNQAMWASIGEWYARLAAGRAAGGPEIEAKARSLVSPNASFMTRVDKIAQYMQRKIRYVGIEIGIGGYRPHAAREVFANQYGDCKDKVTLLIAMLRAVGIHATWVMVDTDRGYVAPDVPSIDGDHMIAAIEIPAGYKNPRMKAVVTARDGKRYLIFDPTNEYVPAGLLPGYEQGGWGLLMAGANSQVIQFPVMAPSTDVTTWSAKLQLAANGTLSGEAQVKLMGASSWPVREFYATSTPTQVLHHMDAVLHEDLNSFTLKSHSVKNAEALDKPFSIHYELTAPGYAQSVGQLLLVRPRVLGSVEEALDHKTRKYPISFPSLGTWRDSIAIKMPAGYGVEDLPDSVHLNMGFADYSSDVKASNGVLHYKRTFVVKKLKIPASDYAQLRKLETAISSDESNTVVLRKQ